METNLPGGKKRKAPWLGYDHKPIHEWDVLLHPSGEKGVVIYRCDSKQWLVDYGDPAFSQLVLQVGEKGQASKIPIYLKKSQKVKHPDLKFCPYCGAENLKYVQKVPRCMTCRAIFLAPDFSRYAHRSPTKFRGKGRKNK